MGSYITTLQSQYKANSNSYLTYILKQAWTDLKLYKKEDSTSTSRVYGKAGDTSEKLFGTVKGLIVTDGFDVVDDFSAGLSDGNFLFTDSVDVVIGDVVAQIRTDARERRYLVEQPEAAGVDNDVIKKYKLSSLGE